MPLGPNTPGTLIILAGAILLVFATISSPIIKPFYFISIQLTSKAALVPLQGTIRLGTFGYCLELDARLACSPLKLGYELSPDTLGIALPVSLDLSTVNPILSKLTYALVLHPIAAGLALLSAILGFVSHIREYSRSCYTSCLSSLASTAALLAFLLDILAFTIAKNRLNAISDQSITVNALLGNAVWITLAGWLSLTLSGFFFCAGRCLFARRHRAQAQADQLRVKPDEGYTKQMRSDAHEAEKARHDASASRHSETSLPAFAEYTSQHSNQEHIPLNRFNPHEDDSSSDHLLLAPAPYPAVALNGVGVGYHRLPPQSLEHHAAVSSRPSVYSDTGAAYPQPAPSFLPPLPPTSSHTPGAPENGLYSNLPAHVSPASNTMNSPHLTPPSSLPYRRLPQSLIPGGGIPDISRNNSHASTPLSSLSPSGPPSLPYPSYERAASYQQQLHDPRMDPGQQQHGAHSGHSSDQYPDRQPSHQSSMDSALFSNSNGVPAHPTPHKSHDAYPATGQTDSPYGGRVLSEEPLPMSAPHRPANNNTHLDPYAHRFDDRNTLYSQTSSATVQAPGRQQAYAPQ